jgi:hypothetical protein
VSRYLLGPVMLAVLVGIGLYGAFCVNVAPTVLPVPSPTVPITVIPAPATATLADVPGDIFTVPPTRPELILATPPLPTATATPTAVPPTSTPEPTPTAVVPMRQRG